MLKQILMGALIGAGMLPTLSFQPQSRVWVEGTSTVRSYRCESTGITGSAQAASAEIAALASVPRAEVSIPVASLDCRNGTMNGHMRKALKAEQNPTIRLRASSVQVSAAGAARISGDLTIAGQTRPVSIDGTVTSEDGKVRVRGSKRLVMTDFGVQPPTLMMGTMKVAAPVTIGFDVVLKP
ncbi:MAG TPA: YceI family protein [Longimicrobium sp.]|jgi:polyisoprenoid-binding protein YceI